MPSRFVILHHQIADGEHWDLMLEMGDVLLTWQLAREPVDQSSLPIPAKRLADHRKAFLDYEGSVSGDRGHVRRVDAGTVDIVELTARSCTFELDGDRFSGHFRLAAADDGWVFVSSDS